MGKPKEDPPAVAPAFGAELEVFDDRRDSRLRNWSAIRSDHQAGDQFLLAERDPHVRLLVWTNECGVLAQGKALCLDPDHPLHLRSPRLELKPARGVGSCQSVGCIDNCACDQLATLLFNDGSSNGYCGSYRVGAPFDDLFPDDFIVPAEAVVERL